MLTIQAAPDLAPGITAKSTFDRQLPSQLRQQVWTILSGLVHDMRQPLSVVEVCADYLNLVLPADDVRARQQIDVLRQQVGEANRILCETLRLLKMSYEPAAPEPVPVDTAASRPLTKAASAAVTY